ncbi:MAG: bifunctional isocitrate dehydrogenase kinase/phosphatase, partial [Thermoanaerobaculia bacterium]|nr:bifunctional isocitrate dehydrogenase kinase/phosphatase [Thermoanaerobaculia bacterium]
ALEQLLGEGLADRGLWVELKGIYSHDILGRDDLELAQTFFNSLTRRVFPHDGVDPAIDYTASDFPLPYRGWEMASARMYGVRRADARVLERIIENAGLRTPFEDLAGDARRAASYLERRLVAGLGSAEIEAVDVLRPVLVRNKAAYLVGRVRRGKRLMPLILAILHGQGGLVVDAVLTAEEEASILFSFARWYFHAEVESPREVIGFLHSILPQKRIAELYISLGYNRHGKTEFYRDLMRHIAASEDRFVVAPGVPGQVMEVFTLPSYDFVFKIIKDFFPPSKRTTRHEVRQRYREVLRHDRVGRLVDFQEFEHVRFPRERFDPGLLARLLASSGRAVSIEGDGVVIRRMYVGRRVRPLDLYLAEHAGTPAAGAAVVEWGRAIEELAAANIFAGDMLLKNFGVTRHGRVVFYDYDELCAVSSCHFREIPPPRTPEEEMAAQPWFSVREGDVFPEELRTFGGLDRELLAVFEAHHGALFTAGFWRRLQERHRSGEILDFYPYRASARLGPAGGGRQRAAAAIAG